MQIQRNIVQRGNPLRSIKNAAFQSCWDFGSGQVDDVHPCPRHHFARQSRNTHFQPLQISGGIDLLTKPSSHLCAGGEHHKRIQIMGTVNLAEKLHAAAAVKPCHFPAMGHSKRIIRKKLGFRCFLRIKIRSCGACLCNALAHRIKHFQRRNQFSACKYLNLQASASHFFYILCEPLSTLLKDRELWGPTGDSPPGDRFFFCQRLTRHQGNANSCSGHSFSHFSDKRTTFHCKTSFMSFVCLQVNI